MKKLLKLPLFFALLLAGSLLAGCVASTRAVVTTGPPQPYYDAYYGPVYRPYYRPYYRPARVVRPAVIGRPRPVIVHPGPRYYHPHAVPYRGGGRRY